MLGLLVRTSSTASSRAAPAASGLRWRGDRGHPYIRRTPATRHTTPWHSLRHDLLPARADARGAKRHICRPPDMQIEWHWTAHAFLAVTPAHLSGLTAGVGGPWSRPHRACCSRSPSPSCAGCLPGSCGTWRPTRHSRSPGRSGAAAFKPPLVAVTTSDNAPNCNCNCRIRPGEGSDRQ
jgi:hypothetical protein